VVSKQFRRPLAMAHPGPAAVISLRRFMVALLVHVDRTWARWKEKGERREEKKVPDRKERYTRYIF
jgi:hypothetical protein